MPKAKTSKEDCDLFGEPIKPEPILSKATIEEKPIPKVEQIPIETRSFAIEVAGREILPDRSIRTTILKT